MSHIGGFPREISGASYNPEPAKIESDNKASSAEEPSEVLNQEVDQAIENDIDEDTLIESQDPETKKIGEAIEKKIKSFISFIFSKLKDAGIGTAEIDLKGNSESKIAKFGTLAAEHSNLGKFGEYLIEPPKINTLNPQFSVKKPTIQFVYATYSNFDHKCENPRRNTAFIMLTNREIKIINDALATASSNPADIKSALDKAVLTILEKRKDRDEVKMARTGIWGNSEAAAIFNECKRHPLKHYEPQ